MTLRIQVPKDPPFVELRGFASAYLADKYVETPSERIPHQDQPRIRIAGNIDDFVSQLHELADILDLYTNYVLTRGGEIKYTRQANVARKHLQS
ncbi:hypothetical protein A3K01_00805 [candidate division WWE3 bacterium RIFOXYD1_FULL_43_17]|uniref:Uncharacterized protein n=3 Tax=Katanobacteria TaxID=422282 RepID=A0A1F4XF06_UNCKA|nr:MAG: hypothetical protein UU59_C0017G0006 [candidate division WWE3 bacterium GW2011_GWE1_41_27]KKS59859.1 MAG: hypothetical protein UV26_C0013G0006 [candidate division WWE3 bacterium GW2011_GWF2_42_42]OGC80226.1 MAG: hypothetical protein A3K01_00805 [candidate division WWE3 bacterium RIFOXYD1_FULL_43_17]